MKINSVETQIGWQLNRESIHFELNNRNVPNFRRDFLKIFHAFSLYIHTRIHGT